MQPLGTTGGASYHAEHFEPLFEVEDRHFWFRSRNRCIAAAVRLIPGWESIRDVVEHGCGTGFVLAELQRLFPRARVVGADPFAEALELARRRFSGTLLQAGVFESGFKNSFDLIGCFDVIEHLDEDEKVLAELGRQLRAGGHLLLTVPAHMSLWSDYDQASGHRRRYSRGQLVERLDRCGFEPIYCTEFMAVLFPLMWVRRRWLWGRRGGRDCSVQSQMREELAVHPVLNWIFLQVLKPEPWWISKRRRLPCGTSLLALARKR